MDILISQPATYTYDVYVYTSLYIKKEQRWILADITRSIGNDIFIYTGVYIYVYIYMCVLGEILDPRLCIKVNINQTAIVNTLDTTQRSNYTH